MNEQEKAVIEEELRKIARRDGFISAPAVVEAARSPSSPLHSHFQWNDDKAAQEYRLWQARQLIAVVRFEPAPNETQRTFTSVIIEQKTLKGESKLIRAYVDTEKALDDPDLRQQILGQAINEVEHWAAKYRHFTELKDIVRAIDKFSKHHKAEYATV